MSIEWRQLTLNRPFGVNICMPGGLYGYSFGKETIPIVIKG